MLRAGQRGSWTVGEIGVATRKVVQRDIVSEVAVSLAFVVAVFEVVGGISGIQSPIPLTVPLLNRACFSASQSVARGSKAPVAGVTLAPKISMAAVDERTSGI